MLERMRQGINPSDGLPEELFLEISGLVPVPNVDLFILDDKGRILLTWRDDPYFGKGWHLPGGCIRFKETMTERVQKTAINELGTKVKIDQDPIAIRDVIVNEHRPGIVDQNQRAHHLAVLFRCYPEDQQSIERLIKNKEAKWFDKIPDNILPVHDVYISVFEEYSLV